MVHLTFSLLMVENKVIRFGESEYGNYIEVKDPSVKTDENKGRIVKEIPLTDEE